MSADSNKSRRKAQRPPGPNSKSRPRSDESVGRDVSDDKVGYCRPPRAHQFKPGQSGFPSGRPKGRKNEATIVQELLYRKVKMREGGRERSVTMLEAIFIRFAQEALKGNHKHAAFLLNRHAALSSNDGQQVELSDNDREVLRAYAKDILAEQGKEDDNGSEQ